MEKIFEETPALWCEEDTDIFNFAQGTLATDVEECISIAVKAVASDEGHVYKQLSTHQFVTSDQVFVEELSQAAYGCEIAFQHTHFPKYNGETGALDYSQYEELMEHGK